MVQSFPDGFRIQEIQTNGAVIHTRVGGQGPAVVLLHGFWRYRQHVGAGRRGGWRPSIRWSSPTCAAWVSPLAAHWRLRQEKTQAGDIALMLDALKIDRVAVVSHDIR